MKRVRQEGREISSRSLDAPGHDARAGVEAAAAAPGAADPTFCPDVAAPRKASATERASEGGRPVDRPTETGASASPTISSGSEGSLSTIDGLLEEALGSGRKYSRGLEMATEAVMAGEQHPSAEQGGSKRASR